MQKEIFKGWGAKKIETCLKGCNGKEANIRSIPSLPSPCIFRILARFKNPEIKDFLTKQPLNFPFYVVTFVMHEKL